jgi:hypothetical protein
MGGIMKVVAKPIKERIEGSIASRKEEDPGICSSCKTATTCTYTKDFRRPVLQCEDFDGYEPRPESPIVKNIFLMADSKSRSNVEEKDSGKYKGLCSICEDRKTCTFIKPEGGVWHCEEYH